MTNSINIRSYGGLGNRLKNIVSGMVLSDQVGLPLHIYWPMNCHLNCRYSDLFLKPQFDCYPGKMGDSIELDIPRNLDWELIINGNRLSFKYNKIRPEYRNTAINYFNKLQPHEYIVYRINYFTDTYLSNNKTTIGIHYRYDNEWLERSDLKQQVSEGETFHGYFIEKMQSYNQDEVQFFVSSSNSSILDYFSEFNNIIVADKKINQNISLQEKNRDKDGAIEALIDMYLLSKCQEIIITPKSTFSECSWYFGGCLPQIYDPIIKKYL